MEELRDTGAVAAIGTGGGGYDSISAFLQHCSLDYVCLPTSYTLLGQQVAYYSQTRLSFCCTPIYL